MYGNSRKSRNLYTPPIFIAPIGIFSTGKTRMTGLHVLKNVYWYVICTPYKHNSGTWQTDRTAISTLGISTEMLTCDKNVTAIYLNGFITHLLCRIHVSSYDSLLVNICQIQWMPIHWTLLWQNLTRTSLCKQL